jgi:hypothetical protein
LRAVLFDPQSIGLKPADLDKLTDREIWAWHLKPALERARRIERAQKGFGNEVVLDPQTPEEHAAAVALIKSVLGGG